MKAHCLLLLLFPFWVSCNNQPGRDGARGQEELLGATWASDGLWDDGQAEVATYTASRMVYGKPRQFEYVFITVKEDFNKQHGVKTDDYSRSDLYEVMKINKFARIETDNYPYHYHTSLFYERAEPGVLHKMTQSSQEWCGNTFKLFQQQGRVYHYLWSSYWDGQGDGRQKIKGAGWFEDGLSHSLRALQFEEGLRFEQGVLESQINNKATPPHTYAALFEVSSEAVLDQDAWKVQVQLEEGKASAYWFAKTYPNVLLKAQSWDGQQLELRSIVRSAYWQ
jgi:hypothetical protein